MTIEFEFFQTKNLKKYVYEDATEVSQSTQIVEPITLPIPAGVVVRFVQVFAITHAVGGTQTLFESYVYDSYITYPTIQTTGAPNTDVEHYHIHRLDHIPYLDSDLVLYTAVQGGSTKIRRYLWVVVWYEEA